MSVITIAGVVLPKRIPWVDQFSFSPATHAARRTLGGKLVLHTSPLHGGRPITLSTQEDQGWVPYSQVLQLQALSEAVDTVYNLQIGSETFEVVFRHSEPPAFEATPLIPRTVPSADDWFKVTMKFLTV
jgi:hypothetical protein